MFPFLYYHCPRKCTDFMSSYPRTGLTECPSPLLSILPFLQQKIALGVLYISTVSVQQKIERQSDT